MSKINFTWYSCSLIQQFNNFTIIAIAVSFEIKVTLTSISQTDLKSNCCVTKTVHAWMEGTECQRMWVSVLSTTTPQIWLTCCCWFVPPYVSMFSPDVCHQKLLEIVHKEEVKVKWILSAKVEVLNSEKGPRDRYKLMGTRHFTPFKKDARKMAREAREPGI